MATRPSSPLREARPRAEGVPRERTADNDFAVECPPLPIDDVGWAVYAPAEWASADSAVSVPARHGSARLPWQVVDASEGGWLSGPGAAPRAVRLEWLDGKLICTLADTADVGGIIAGSVAPCDGDYMVMGCRTAGFAFERDACRFSLNVLAHGPCRITALPVDGEAAFRPDKHEVFVEPVAGSEVRATLKRPARVLGARLVGLTVVSSIRRDDALQPGDVVLAVNNTEVATQEELAAFLSEAVPWDVVVRVDRGGEVVDVPLHPILEREGVFSEYSSP